MGKEKWIIELSGFDAVTLYRIVDKFKDAVKGENEDWTTEYRKVLTEVSSQLSKQLGFD